MKMKTKTAQIRSATPTPPPIEAQPVLGQRGRVIQPYGALVLYPLAVSEQARRVSVEGLNQMLADTLYLRDMFKKHHWQVTGPTFYPLHLLFEKFFVEQNELVDMIGERVQTLGGVSVAMPNDVAEMTNIEHPPRDREQVPVQLSRLLEALSVILTESHRFMTTARENRDDGTENLIAGNIIPTNEKQVWFLSQHLVDTPLVRAR